MDRKLKRLLSFYLTAAACCAVIVCLGIVADRYAASLMETFDVYQTLKINKAEHEEFHQDHGCHHGAAAHGNP